jgi:hypothetical protein
MLALNAGLKGRSRLGLEDGSTSRYLKRSSSGNGLLEMKERELAVENFGSRGLAGLNEGNQLVAYHFDLKTINHYRLG